MTDQDETAFKKTQASFQTFGKRKKDHIELSLTSQSQSHCHQLSLLKFQHNPLPEIDFDEIQLKTHVFGHALNSPLFVSSMTLGHDSASPINRKIASQCQKRGWMMGVGSQRRQLFDPLAFKECESLREEFPNLVIFGNLGLSQLITTPVDKVQILVDSLKAQFMAIHTNPLQEVLQPEGTPNFKGGIKALKQLCKKLNCPVVLKETGCGFSKESFKLLTGIGLAAIDISGFGGTHWGRIEGLRQKETDVNYKVAKTFFNWGLSTVESIKNGLESDFEGELWASGGVRDGLSAAKFLALGTSRVGYAKPIMESALLGEETLSEKMEQLDQELKVSLFCLGLSDIPSLVGRRDLLKESWTTKEVMDNQRSEQTVFY